MIQVVTHVYAEKHPEYAVFLRAHLSSIVLDADDVSVLVTICYASGDVLVEEVLREFGELLGERLELMPMTKGELFRRSIGRNRAAKQTVADLVWFCDVDHVFGPGCLSRLWAIWTGYRTIQPPIMVWPDQIMIHTDHSTGDKWWQSHIKSTGLISPNPRDFIPKSYRKAIGGVQIVDGEYCRLHGYLDGFPKWQVPTDGLSPFPDFRDDVKFRGLCEYRGMVERIDLPNIFRLRHSIVTYKGIKKL